MTIVDTLDAREHYVYRLSDANGDLLYIGMTASLPSRLAQHAADKPWWPMVADVSFERVADRATAARLERQAIHRDQPTMNKVRSIGRSPIRNFRVSDELYYDAMTTANLRGDNLSTVIRQALRDYTADPDKWADEHPKEDM